MVGFSIIFVIIFNLKTIFVVFGRNYLRKRYSNFIIYSLYIVAYLTHIILKKLFIPLDFMPSCGNYIYTKLSSLHEKVFY